jgi:TolB-like protein/DNA-binding winged helix-turn-helix (wHTH) protein/Tfp pilus assembly protein PilF
MAPLNVRETIRFGDYELDPQTCRLSRQGRVLKLERIPTEILLFLIEHKGELVSREQIADRIWGKDVFLDTDNSINGAIRKIRQVLKDDAEQPRFVQTITGRGYRFIGAITESEAAPAADSTPPSLSDSGSAISPAATAQRRTDWRLLTAASLALLLFAALAGWIVWSRSRAAQAKPDKVMLAVLPFDNLTGDPAQEYFSDGLTEEMITQMGSLNPAHLGVIGRTSVMRYKTTRTPLDQIGRELGVQYVLEGSIRRDANSVRVAAQLIQTNDQTHVWARQYDRELTGLLSLQGEIAREIADEIQLTLGNDRSAPVRVNVPAQNYEAYDLYLRGQYFFNKRTAADLEQAITYFEQAIGKDPSYARAYAGIAGSYALLPGFNGHPQGEFIAKGRPAALKALQLDDSLAEAHTALALIVQNFDWDWQTAEKEFRRAIELNPNYATAHHWYAEHLMWRGRFDEALQESERARQLDPLSLIIAADNGAILYFSRQYDRAIEKWRSVLEMDPDFRRAHLIIGAYTEKGLFDQALAEHDRLRPKNQGFPWYWSWVAYIHGRAGQTAEARHAQHELLRLNRNGQVDPFIVASAYLGTSDKEQVLAWLEKAYAAHSTNLVSLKVNPGYDFLRSDPRFQDLLRRVGLAE